MAIIDHLKCGRIIVFNTMFAKLRWAFCIDYNTDHQIVYRGLFGLKTIDKKTFLGFARIVDVFDYIDRELTEKEKGRLKAAYKMGIMKTCSNVEEFVDKLYREAKIKLFVNSEGWAHVDIHKK